MNILAFESSCDETAVAVVRDGRAVSPTPSSLRRICTLSTAASCRKLPPASTWRQLPA